MQGLITKIFILLFFLPLSLFAEEVPNLAYNKTIRSFETSGDINRVVDSSLAETGGRWNGDYSVVLHSINSSITIDFGEVQNFRAFLIQADNNDVYLVEGSSDGVNWHLFHRFLPLEGMQGLQIQHAEYQDPYSARYIRLRASHGDQAYSISEFQAFEIKPTEWFEHLDSNQTTLKRLLPTAMLTQERADLIKQGLCVLGLIVLVWTALLRILGRDEIHRKARNIVFILAGILAGVFWFNGFRFHFSGYVHHWDFYHYYIGAKYAPELGYNLIYDCGVVVDLEDGFSKAAEGRKYRNLRTNSIELIDHLTKNPRVCTDHFSKERWQEFKHDVVYFRDKMSRDRWQRLHLDHGFNGTPVWTILGYILSSTGPASDNQILWLAVIDSVLVSVMWLFVLWAFGWEAMCVGLLYWGTNYPARFWWTGGSFLRQDWLFWSVIGVCFLKKNFHTLAGFSLVYATLLRIFPGALLVPLFFKYLIDTIKQKSILPNPGQRRFAIGAIGGGVILVALSFLPSQDKDVWKGFIYNSKKHLETPLTNNMGLKTVTKFQFDHRARFAADDVQSDPFYDWKREQLETFQERKLIYFAIVLAFLFLLIKASCKNPDWVGAALGAGLVPIATELTCYYYSILAILGFLWIKQMRVGIILLVFSWLSYFIAEFWEPYDEHFVYISAVCVVMVFYFVYLFSQSKAPSLSSSNEMTE
ncbi:MAG: discoidin domain-containing protein [Deltaproteobacteria bacterium]|nr:discoidin domain-containing protein [Deltaproteobacteria bacterium]